MSGECSRIIRPVTLHSSLSQKLDSFGLRPQNDVKFSLQREAFMSHSYKRRSVMLAVVFIFETIAGAGRERIEKINTTAFWCQGVNPPALCATSFINRGFGKYASS